MANKITKSLNDEIKDDKPIKKVNVDFLEDTNIKRTYTNEELNNLYLGVKEGIIQPYIQQELPLLKSFNPAFYSQAIAGWDESTKKNQISSRFGRSISNIKDLEDYLNWALDFYHQIKTSEQFTEQFERFERLLYQNYQIKFPILVGFDYQIEKISDIGRATFYSIFNDKIETPTGTGSHIIAFNSYVPLLTDDELMMMIRHEFGHIIQGHCTIRAEYSKQLGEYRNQAMDISINLDFDDKDKENLMTGTEKMWGEGATGCMSLNGKKEDGGYGLKAISSAGNWQKPLAVLTNLLPPKKDDDGGGGGPPGPPGPPSPPDDKIKVGDYIDSRKGDGKYGKVISIDSVTGKMDVELLTDEQWKQVIQDNKK
jgi:hypothetical protein